LFRFQNEHCMYISTNVKLRTTKAFWLEEWSVLNTAIMWIATSRKQVTN